VLVDEPSWFLLFGRYAQLGARMIGVPRLSDGPDLARLRALAAEHRPKLFVTSSVLHNPTSTGIGGQRVPAAAPGPRIRLSWSSRTTSTATCIPAPRCRLASGWQRWISCSG
jgi:hypothetical protein